MNKKMLSFLVFGIALSITAKGASDYTLLEDFEKSNNYNMLGGQWYVYDDNSQGGTSSISYERVSSHGFDSSGSLQIQWAIGEGVEYPFAGLAMQLKEDRSPINLEEYQGVQFYAKGEGSIEVLLLTTATDETHNNFSYRSVQLTSQWMLYQIPFSDFSVHWGTEHPWDATDVISVEWSTWGRVGETADFYLDNIGFYREPSPLLDEQNRSTEVFILDDLEDGDQLSNTGGIWGYFDDKDLGGTSTVSFDTAMAPGYNSSSCYHADFTTGSESEFNFSGVVIPMTEDFQPMDLSEYYGVRFYAKGEGDLQVMLSTTDTRVTYNHFTYFGLELTDQWTLYEVPFSRFSIFWGENHPWKPQDIVTLEWQTVSEPNSYAELYLDDIGFYAVEVLQSDQPIVGESDMAIQPMDVEEIEQQRDISSLRDQRVAIVGLDSLDLEPSISRALLSFISNALVNKDVMKVMDRNSVDRILSEQRFQLNDFSDTSKMVEIGQLAGAEYIMVGDFSNFADTYYLNVKMISVETSEIVASSVVTANAANEFMDMCSLAIDKLF